MAVVLIRLKGNKQQATTGNAASQRVEQRAAAMPQAAAVSPSAQQASEVSYMTAFTLIAVVGGIFLISQYK